MEDSARQTVGSDSFWDGRTVVITGGTGSLGTALVDDLLGRPVHAVRVVSRDEYKQALLGQRVPDSRLRLLVGDVRDRERMRRACEGADIVIHTAALKRVSTDAYDPFETVQTNIIGTMNVINAAIDAGVERVLGISTDKCVMASNLYGATKFVLEQLLMQGNVYAGSRRTRCSAVRYGNVLGSRGSVLEVWREQMAKQGYVTLTDARMTRFWLTLAEACVIVRQAVEDMQEGEVFVPPLRRSQVTTLLGAYFGGQPPVQVVGLRHGGEKLHEDLLSPHERCNSWNGVPGAYVVCASGGKSLSVRSCDEPLESVESLQVLLEQAGCIR